jgi:hypothetical protein
MTWKALHLLGPASRTYIRIFSSGRTVIGLALYGEDTGEVRELVDRIRDHIKIWLR